MGVKVILQESPYGGYSLVSLYPCIVVCSFYVIIYIIIVVLIYVVIVFDWQGVLKSNFKFSWV